MIPLTPNGDLIKGTLSPRGISSHSSDGMINDEVTRLHYQYRKLIEKNRE